MGNAFTWEQDDDIWNHFYACACSKHMWESNEMTIRIIRFLDDMGSIMSWSPTIVTCSCYNNDFYMHYPIMWKHCGSYDGFRRTFYRSWYMLYGSKSSFLYHFHYAENNLASNRGLIPSSSRPRWFEKVVSCWFLVNISMISNYTPELTGHGHAEKPIDNGYGVDMSMFLSEEMMPPCQLRPTKCLLPLDALWNSYRCLSTWEFTKLYLWRIDWIVMLPMLLVMSCWWPYGHLPTGKRRIKHSEQ